MKNPEGCQAGLAGGLRKLPGSALGQGGADFNDFGARNAFSQVFGLPNRYFPQGRRAPGTRRLGPLRLGGTRMGITSLALAWILLAGNPAQNSDLVPINKRNFKIPILVEPSKRAQIKGQPAEVTSMALR